jgi:hypothetical protein
VLFIASHIYLYLKTKKYKNTRKKIHIKKNTKKTKIFILKKNVLNAGKF